MQVGNPILARLILFTSEIDSFAWLSSIASLAAILPCVADTTEVGFIGLRSRAHRLASSADDARTHIQRGFADLSSTPAKSARLHSRGYAFAVRL